MIYVIIIVIIIAILLYFETTTLIIAGFVLGIILAYFRAKRKTDLFLFFDRKNIQKFTMKITVWKKLLN